MEFAEHRERMDRESGEQFFHLQEKSFLYKNCRLKKKSLLSPSVHIVSSMELTLTRTTDFIEVNYWTIFNFNVEHASVAKECSVTTERGLTAVY